MESQTQGLADRQTRTDRETSKNSTGRQLMIKKYGVPIRQAGRQADRHADRQI